MLSYEHIYHAGNHADIVKHLTLTLILERLRTKEKPFTVYDTHAGFGVYDLTDVRAQKTNEAESGVRRLLAATMANDDTMQPANSDGAEQTAPATTMNVATVLAPYLSLCRAYAEQKKYPGSPEIARNLLRPTDSLMLSELHPQAIEVLRANMKTPPISAKKTRTEQAAQTQPTAQEAAYVKPQIHYRNGYEMLRALTPPQTKRGMAIIDPSFEEAQDFTDCADTICAVHERWQNGILALWYPLLEHRATETARMKQQIISCAGRTATEENVLDIQLAVQSPQEKTGLAKLYGSGMLVVNFPYQLDEQMKTVLPWLTNVLGNENATWSVKTF